MSAPFEVVYREEMEGAYENGYADAVAKVLAALREECDKRRHGPTADAAKAMLAAAEKAVGNS